MNIRTKLVLIIMFIILVATLPISYLMLNKAENDIVLSVLEKQKMVGEVLVNLTKNFLLNSGVNIESTKLDLKEIKFFFEPEFKRGLVYADSILLSEKSQYNGMILNQVQNKKKNLNFIKSWNLSETHISSKELNEIFLMDEKVITFLDKNSGEEFFGYIKIQRLSNGIPICASRVFFSKSIALKEIYEQKKISYTYIVVALFTVGILGIFVSRIFTKPFLNLMYGIKKIESGDLTYQVPIKSSDEFGLLASSFNSMSFKLLNNINKLKNLNLDLENALKLKDEFLANTSHELRTPIHGIVGITESILDGVSGEINNELRGNLNMILSSGRRLATLVDDILDLSRLRENKIHLKMSKVDVRVIVDQIFSILSMTMNHENFLKNNDIPEYLSFINADENRIYQVFMNLLSNAFKFTKNGSITVSAYEDLENHKIIYTIEDTGIGIPMNKYDSIFESFEQADGSIERKYGGTGLGLSISKKIIELHGGSIWVESKVGVGSTFYLSFDRVDDDKFTDDNDQIKYISIDSLDNYEKDNYDHNDFEQNDKNLKKEQKVLIVDDEVVNIQVLINNLSLIGYEIFVAKSGKEALEKIKNETLPDIVLLDVMMPEMSGFDVCKTIRKDWSQYQLPILMLTAKKGTEDVIYGLKCGANDYITKPFSKSELLTRVENLIKLKEGVEHYKTLSILQEELDVASSIQKAILPKSTPSLNGIDISFGYKSADEIGGDFLGFHQVDNRKVGLFIADVAGHGVPAALISSMLKVIFNFEIIDYASTPDKFMFEFNNVLCEDEHERFVTASYGFIDLEKMKITTSNAGHWPIIILRDDEIIKITARGIFMGVLKNVDYEVTEYDLLVGDRVVFYTDGIIEERSVDNEMFGEERFFDLIIKGKTLSPDKFINLLYDDLIEFTANKENERESFEDDITFIVADIISS